MKMKYITAAFLGILLLNSPAQMTVNAVDNSTYEQYERAIGLIEKCSIKCTPVADGAIEITAKTQVSGKISEVGFRNVVVQYSSDGQNWSDEVSLGDLTNSNARYYSLDSRRVEVKGGGFYRVSVVHYAREGGSSDRIQTVVQTSSSKWVQPKPQPVTTTTARRTTTSTTTTTTRTTSKRVTTTSTTAARRTTSSAARTTSATVSGTSARGRVTAAPVNGAKSTMGTRTETAAKATSKPSQTTTAAAAQSSSPKTGDRLPVMEFTALCSAGAVALFLHSKRPKRS
jgi:type IV secretory pathway VirJ component